MQVFPAEKAYVVSGLKQTLGKGNSINLTWDIKDGNYYMILVSDARYSFEISNVCKSIENEKNDVEFVNSNKQPVYKNESYEIYLISKKNLMANNHSYTIINNGMKNNIPKRIQVFSCDYNSIEGILSIYHCTENKENTTYLQGVIDYLLVEHKKLLGSRYYELVVGTNSFFIHNDEIDEQCIVEYYIDGRVSYPIPIRCMGKKLYIVTPDNEDIQVRIAEKYKNQYKAYRNN